jgi:hypothetical protein
MDFADALRAVKDGRKVQRRSWQVPGKGWEMEIAQPALPDGRQVNPLLMCRREDGVMVPFTGGSWDLLADDWEVVP